MGKSDIKSFQSSLTDIGLLSCRNKSFDKSLYSSFRVYESPLYSTHVKHKTKQKQ